MQIEWYRGYQIRLSFWDESFFVYWKKKEMKLNKKNMVVIRFMLFSLFFGAGNLIFPPFLEQNAGEHTFTAMAVFLLTAVVLPVLGVIVVARFDGLDKLSGKAGKRFAFIFTVLIYLSIGPGLGIPRVTSVPFEMAVSPYLPNDANRTLWMVLYSALFFLVALWLCLNPGKLVQRIGRVLTPSLLILLVLLFISFVTKGNVNVAPALDSYQSSAFLKGFTEGYNTMDTIAALNFGLVISTTLVSFGLNEKKDRITHTVYAGIFAGSILAIVYVMLSYMGMCSSGVYAVQENGAWTLRCIVQQVFGDGGAILLAAIFTLACLTTCVGLINSISQFFSILFKKISYKVWVIAIVCFSFLVCNLGLNVILSISVPVLNIVYPVSIVLILLGLTDTLWVDHPYVYPFTVLGTAVFSVLHTLDTLEITFGVFSDALKMIPLYSSGFGWVIVASGMMLVSILVDKMKNIHASETQNA